MFDWNTFLEQLGAGGSAVVLGGLIGVERELRRRWAGMRTHMLVSLGSALFVLAMTTPHRSNPDVSRVIQGIAAGVGFIGAGTILKLSEKLEVKGLTTASSIWLAAAVGTACGLKLYALAVSGVLLALVVLVALSWVEKAMGTEDDGQDAPRSPGSRA
jgi:putative Mg2+ transporter-C (MgtC) family protein